MKSDPTVLRRAFDTSQDAASLGFDWECASDALAKVREEAQELEEALDAADAARIEDEAGDLLLAVVNVCRKAKVDPAECLDAATTKFQARFMKLTAHVHAEGFKLQDLDSEALEERWQLLKHAR